jgi:hypothetical protein
VGGVCLCICLFVCLSDCAHAVIGRQPSRDVGKFLYVEGCEEGFPLETKLITTINVRVG